MSPPGRRRELRGRGQDRPVPRPEADQAYREAFEGALARVGQRHGGRSVPPLDPRSWEQHAAFRETFLAAFGDDEAQQAARRIGRALYLGTLGAAEPAGPPVEVAADLAAVAADLRFLEGYLGEIAGSPDLAGQGEALSRLARGWAGGAAVLAEQIEAAVRTPRPPVQKGTSGAAARDRGRARGRGQATGGRR